MPILRLEAGTCYVYSDYGIIKPHLAFTSLSTATLFASYVHIEYSVQSALCHCGCSESELASPSNLAMCDGSSPSSSNSSSSSSSWLLPSLSSLERTDELMSDESMEKTLTYEVTAEITIWTPIQTEEQNTDQCELPHLTQLTDSVVVEEMQCFLAKTSVLPACCCHYQSSLPSCYSSSCRADYCLSWAVQLPQGLRHPTLVVGSAAGHWWTSCSPAATSSLFAQQYGASHLLWGMDAATGHITKHQTAPHPSLHCGLSSLRHD